MKGCKCFRISQILHILLHWGTNLAARLWNNNWWCSWGLYHGCNRKSPMVKIVTTNKHCREIARIKKNLFTKPIKSKNMFSSQYASSGIFSLTIFRLGLKERGTYGAWEYENYTDCTLGTPSWRDTLGDTDTTLLALYVVRHKSPSVGEIGEHLATGAISTKDGANSALLKKERKKK